MPIRRFLQRLRSAIDKVQQQRHDPEAVAPAVHSMDELALLLGRGDRTIVAKMRATAEGRRLLDERRDILAVVSDRDRLRALPEGSLGWTYCRFAEENGLFPEDLAEAVREARVATGGLVPEATPEVAYLHDRYRDLHDLWHVVTGYGTDMAGELAIVNFQATQVGYRAMTINAWIRLFTIAIQTGRLDILVTSICARARGRRAAYLLAVDWERLLPVPLEDVRRELAIEPLPPYRTWDYPAPAVA